MTNEVYKAIKEMVEDRLLNLDIEPHYINKLTSYTANIIDAAGVYDSTAAAIITRGFCCAFLEGEFVGFNKEDVITSQQIIKKSCIFNNTVVQ